MVFGLENYVANPYLRALIILIIASLVLRIVVWIVQKIVLGFTAKTKTDIDDKFVVEVSND